VTGALAYLGTSAGADASLAPALISFVAGRPAWLCQRPSPGYRPGRWWARHQAGLHPDTTVADDGAESSGFRRRRSAGV